MRFSICYQGLCQFFFFYGNVCKYAFHIKRGDYFVVGLFRFKDLYEFLCGFYTILQGRYGLMM